MQFTKPIPFAEAVEKLGARSIIGSKLRSSEWSEVPVALRERAFFSAQVENIRFLQRARDTITDFLTGARETVTLPDGTTTTALKTGSRADFVKLMQDFLAAEGITRSDGGLTDIAGEKRLALIFDTQTTAANEYGNWKQGMDPDVLDEFPAWRFIREADVEKPRALHQQNEGVVRLKTDVKFWTAMNDESLGGFGVPWGPWGFNSGMGVEDVDRAEAEKLGLLAPRQRIEPAVKDFNDGLKAGVRNLDADLVADLVAKLKEQFGNQVMEKDGAVWWNAKLTDAGPRTPDVW